MTQLIINSSTILKLDFFLTQFNYATTKTSESMFCVTFLKVWLVLSSTYIVINSLFFIKTNLQKLVENPWIQSIFVMMKCFVKELRTIGNGFTSSLTQY